jgi:uncharacterized protein YecE (DUF72 family)
MMKENFNKVKYFIGCSGFHYEEWKEKFYPAGLAKTKWFEYYTGFFNTVELNVTFYRTMKLSFFENLYKRSPGNFQFSVKASKIITHYKKFNDVKAQLTDFYATITEGLKEKLGCVLFQLPPNFIYKEEYAERIIQQMDPGFKNIIEFRHATWWKKKIYLDLKKAGITFCTVSYPGLPDDLIINNKTVYIRLHGVPVLYRSAYSIEFLNELADQLKNNKTITEVYLYFDNTDRGEAIRNATQIKTMLGLL